MQKSEVIEVIQCTVLAKITVSAKIFNERYSLSYDELPYVQCWGKPSWIHFYIWAMPSRRFESKLEELTDGGGEVCHKFDQTF